MTPIELSVREVFKHSAYSLSGRAGPTTGNYIRIERCLTGGSNRLTAYHCNNTTSLTAFRAPPAAWARSHCAWHGYSALQRPNRVSAGRTSTTSFSILRKQESDHASCRNVTKLKRCALLDAERCCAHPSVGCMVPDQLPQHQCSALQQRPR